MKQGRGRPKGDGIDDTAVLNRIADSYVGGSHKMLSIVLRSLEPDLSDSASRRIRRKWRRP